ncbi:MAG: AMP-binding protein [Hyphomicrobiales bacterium]
MSTNWKEYNSLIINDEYRKGKQLESFCHDKLSSITEEWEKCFYTFILSWLDDYPHITIRTSGSTGNPKEITILKEKMIVSAKRTGTFFGFKENQRALLCLPSNKVGGMMMIVRAFVYKMNLLIVKPSSTPLHTETLPLDFVPMTPMQAQNIINIKEGSNFLKEINTIILGGSSLHTKLSKQLTSFPNNIYSTYGMTETISHIALHKIGDTVNCYTLLEGINISLDDRGCLIIHQDNEKDIITNDIAEIQKDGSFVIKGRYDNIINTGGIKLIPEEVEHKITELLKLDSSIIVFGIDDDLYGQKLCCLIESENNNIINQHHINILKEHLINYEVPKKWFYTNQFKRLANDKINRFATINKILE